MANSFTKFIGNAKTRTFVLVIAAILIAGIVTIVISSKKPDEPLENKTSSIVAVPKSVQSTPGESTTPRYRELQEKANIRGAQQAEEEGKTFVPTITSSINEGFDDNAKQQFESAIRGLGVTTTKGCSAGDAKVLQDQGYVAFQIALEMKKRNCNIEDIAKALRALGYSLDEIIAALATAGFNNNDIASALKSAGFNDKEIQDALAAIEKKCSADSVRDLQKQGYNAAQIAQTMQRQGCSIDHITKALQDLGYSQEQINGAIASLNPCSSQNAIYLKEQGNSAVNIANTMRNAGCNNEDIMAALQAAGFNNNEIQEALAEIHACSTQAAKFLKDQNYSTIEIVKNMQLNGCNAEDITKALRELGYNIDDINQALQAAGFNTARDFINNSNNNSNNSCSSTNAKNLQDQGMDARAIAITMQQKGCSAQDIAQALKEIGYNPMEITAALRAAGFNNDEITAALRNAGFDAADILSATAALTLSEQNLEDLLAKQRELEAQDAREAIQEQQRQASEQLLALNQQRLQAIQQVASAMENQKNSAFAAWNEVPLQAYMSGAHAKTLTSLPEENKNNVMINNQTQNDNYENKNVLKAGTLMFAVLETAVNSDEPGPILARIVSPPLKQTLLIGSISLAPSGEKLALTFDTANIPDHPVSYQINAVAIDPDTARTALASDVNHHYILKWGTTFASAFLEGYSGAVAGQGTTTVQTQSSTGTVTSTSKPPLTGREQLFTGLGKVAETWSNSLGEYKNIKPTVTIESGASLGILLVSDFELGKLAPQKDSSNNFKQTGEGNKDKEAIANLINNNGSNK